MILLIIFILWLSVELVDYLHYLYISYKINKKIEHKLVEDDKKKWNKFI